MSISAAANGKLVYEFAAGYHGTTLHYVSPNSAALGICGNSLVYYSLSGGITKHLMWGSGYGISKTAYHPWLDYVAYAEKGLKPLVHIHDCSTSREVVQLTEAAEMEVTAIAFATDGSRLCTASREPDFRLILWDIDKENNIVTKCKQAEIDWLVEYMSFSPVSADRVCISGSGHLALWTLHRSFHRTTFAGHVLMVDKYAPHCHTWATHSDIIYVGCTKGELLSFDVKPPSSPKVAPPIKEVEQKRRGHRHEEKQDERKEEKKEEKGAATDWHFLIAVAELGKITHICARDGHIVVAGAGGHMRWVTVSKEPPEEVKTKRKKGEKKNKRKKRKGRDDEKHEDTGDVKLDAGHFDCVSRVVCELCLNVPHVTSMQYRNDGLQLLVGASNGIILTVRVNQRIMEPELRATSPELLPALISIERGAEIDWEIEFHDGAILAIGFIREAKFIVTAGKDGTVRCWTSDRGKEISCLHLKAAQNCLATSDKHNVVATGAANGTLHVLKVDSIGRSAVVLYMKLHVGSVDQISFSGNEAYVVAASKEDGRFFFLLNRSLDFEDLELLGYSELKNPILAHTWDTPIQVLSTLEALLLTGGADGAVQIRGRVLDPLHVPQRVLDVRLYDAFTGGITCMAVVNGKICTGGAAGVIFCCDTNNCGLRRGKQISVELSVVQKHEQNVEARYLLAGQPYRMELKSRIQILKQEFQELYDKNLQAPELEKLSAKELLVDVELERQLRDKLQNDMLAVAEEVRIRDLKNDILVERIKQDCYGSMQDPQVLLHPFAIGHPVQSFPILKERGYNVNLANLAKHIRMVEMREWHYIKQLNKKLARDAAELAAKQAADQAAQEAAHSAALEAADLEESSVSDMHVEGDQSSRSKDDSNFEDTDSVDEMASTEAQSSLVEPVRAGSRRGSTIRDLIIVKSPNSDGETGSKTATESIAVPPSSGVATIQPSPVDIDDDDDIELNISETAPAETFLYGTFELTTPKRKRIQRFLHFMQLEEIRATFNAKMLSSKQNKIQLIQKIAEMVDRIRELHRMLGGQGDFPLQSLNESVEGMPDIFEVKDEEVMVQKYQKRSERAKAEQQHKADEEQLRLRAGNNAAERALQDMMGGKLEKKIEVLTIESEIQRPKWMLGNPKGFTKEQHKELKEFELMLKQIKDEKEKKIRGQEAEQRKLVSEIQDMTSSFDKEVLDLFNQRIQDEVKCTAIEENISRFAVNVEIDEFADERREVEMTKTMEKLKSAKAQSVSALTEFRREEVTSAQWERLLEARTRKMQQEDEVKKLTAVMNEMQGCLSELTFNDDGNRKQIEQVLRSLAEFRESREKKRKNMIVPLKMKQGLVEAELKPLEGEYINVGLLPRAIIVECNEVVLLEANSKIEMMKKMRAWKADNNLIKWEIARFKLQQQHVAEKIRHLQLLRVTKANQNVIKTGEDPSSASEALALANRHIHLVIGIC